MKKGKSQSKETDNSKAGLLDAVLTDSWTEEFMEAKHNTKSTKKKQSKNRGGMR